MKPILEVKNISKKYQISGQESGGYLSLRESVTKFFKAGSGSSKEDFWALKDISFDVFPGDSIGIIGKNGAGKSTLLKILSKITPPTSGKIISRGRIASLLEVGTGFHPELTGRENIFLNGSILGLKRNEIIKHFDSIISFSGVEKFIDTPLKHYSSGMQLRLAFAVAAHLEPEILIIDEVLAVGDAEFQKRCMGKMEEVSKSGRTILFVSHNMGLTRLLCQKSCLLNKGTLLNMGETADIIDQYLNINSSSSKTNNSVVKNKNQYIQQLFMVNAKKNISSIFSHKEEIKINLSCVFNTYEKNMRLGLAVLDINNRRVFTTETEITIKPTNMQNFIVSVPGDTLIPGQYKVFAAIHIPNIVMLDTIDENAELEIIDEGNEFSIYNGSDLGSVFVKCKWETV